MGDRKLHTYMHRQYRGEFLPLRYTMQFRGLCQSLICFTWEQYRIRTILTVRGQRESLIVNEAKACRPFTDRRQKSSLP